MKQLKSINRLNFDNNHINIKGIFQLAQIGISIISGNEYFPLLDYQKRHLSNLQ